MNDAGSNGELYVCGNIFKVKAAVLSYMALICVFGSYAAHKTYALPDRLISPLSVSSDCFGCSIAFSGNTMAIGEFGGSLSLQQLAGGVVNIYIWNGSNWQLQQRIQAADVGTNDHFGTSVDIEGDTLVIGTARDDVSAGDDRGSVYVYTRSGSVWSQQQKLVPNDLLSLARFGSSVSISGETLLAGASGQPDIVPASQQIGTAYIYTRSGTTWTQQAKLDPSDGALQDEFGLSVDLSGDTALIGSPNGPTGAGANTGTAYVFTRTGTSWSFQSKLVGALISPLDRFGESVGLDGETAVVGSPFDDVVNVGNDAGSAYIFVRNGSVWSEQRKIIPSDSFVNTFFGNSVAINGSDIAIASTAAGALRRGSLYVYRRFGTEWRQQAAGCLARRR